jgi:hypothetical protein
MEDFLSTTEPKIESGANGNGANGTTDEAAPSRLRLMLSLAMGLADLTNERVSAVLAACSAVAPPVSVEEPIPGAPISVRHAALGFLLDTVGRAARAPARARIRWRRMVEAARTGTPLDRARRLADRLPGIPRARGRLDLWRARGRNQLARWAALGRREHAQSRVLAFDALTVLRENVLARVSESPDVKNVIREQSQGIAQTAMGELRDRSARADNLAERTVGRLFHDGRGPRSG